MTKVEPPNWWTGQTLNPVRVLIRGSDFTRAKVTPPPGLSVDHVSISESGNYVFVDVNIPPDLAPGDYPLKLETAAGEASAPFRIDAPLDRAGRFAGFSPDDVIYLIMPDRFANGDPSNDDPVISKGLFGRRDSHLYHGGDLQGIIDHLPYLKQLGVTALWLTPIYDNNNHMGADAFHPEKPVSDYHGYGAVDYYGMEEHFGSLELLKKMVDEAHSMGIKVIQDQVANHCGPTHVWVKDPPAPTWFNGTPAHHLVETFNLWNLIDPHAAPDLVAPVLRGWFADALPDFNQDDAEVKTYEIQNALWWVGKAGFDGIRQDTLPYVSRSFWSDWSKALKLQYPKLRAVGEVLDGNPAITSYFQGGREREGVDSGIDSVFDYPVYFALRDVFTHGKNLDELIKMVANDRLYPDAATLVTIFGDHDVSRFMSEKGASPDKLRLALTFIMTARGTPVIYYGDEIGMQGGDDPDNRRDFPGGWPSDKVNAFLASGRTAQQAAIFDFVSKLAKLRARYPALRRGEMVSLTEQQQAWVYSRRDESGVVLIAINNGTKDATLNVRLADGGTLHGVLNGGSDLVFHEGSAAIRLAAGKSEIYALTVSEAK